MKTLTDAEKKALLRVILGRRDLASSECDCALHRLSPKERAARIDAAIDATNAQIRDGLLPEEDDI